jgi:hypothetical protein
MHIIKKEPFTEAEGGFMFINIPDQTWYERVGK